MTDTDNATLPKLLCERAKTSPDAQALREKSYGIWRAITWRGYRDRVEEIARQYQRSAENCDRPAASLVSECEHLPDGKRRVKGFHRELCGTHVDPEQASPATAHDSGATSAEE